MMKRSFVLLIVVVMTASISNAYYNPQQGRWLNRDPIEERGGNNVYAFLESNPVNTFDLRGLKEGGPCCKVESFSLKIKGWKGKWPGYAADGHYFEKKLRVIFKLALKDGSKSKNCIIRQTKQGEARAGDSIVKGPWPEPVADGSDWWTGSSWSIQVGKWNFSETKAKFEDNPGYGPLYGTTHFPVYLGGAGGSGYFKFQTQVVDKENGDIIRTLSWGMLIDYKTWDDGKEYYYY